jgi:putative sterol carrier protein
MDLQEIGERIRAKFEEPPKIEAMVQFDFDEDGTVLYNGTVDPATAVVGDIGDAKTTFKCSLETFRGFLNGSKSPDLAFMMGQLKIEGSLSLAMKLKERLEG